MLLKSCGRCGNLISYGATYCPTCKPIVEEERERRRAETMKTINKRYNKTRDPKYSRFYNGIEWRTLSAKRLQDDGYRCVMCGGIATEVDHIIPIQSPEGWERRLYYDNTRSLCHGCHDKRHNRFIKKNKKSNT